MDCEYTFQSIIGFFLKKVHGYTLRKSYFLVLRLDLNWEEGDFKGF